MNGRITVVLLSLAVVGCPPKQERTAPGVAGACAKAGQSCEVSPGKLGTCVQNDACPLERPCFVCQSQH